LRAGSYLPTRRGTSSASLRTATPDRRPHTAPDLLPVAYPRSREHDEEPFQRWRIPTRARSNSANFLTHDNGVRQPQDVPPVGLLRKGSISEDARRNISAPRPRSTSSTSR